MENQQPKKSNLLTIILISLIIIIIITIFLILFLSSSKTITEQQLFSGTTIELKENQIIKLELNQQEYEMTLEPKNNSVNINIGNIHTALQINQEKNIDLNNDNTFDLKIKFNNLTNKEFKLTLQKINESSCIENWTCVDWETCSNQTQTRTCTDSNNCTTTSSKPTLTQSCSAECEEKFLSERGCKNDNTIQRKFQYANCTSGWKVIHLCGELKCDEDEDSITFTQCREYTCDELDGEICNQNKTCTDNDIKITLDTDECCVSDCITNSTA